jgi:hypothetical protein
MSSTRQVKRGSPFAPVQTRSVCPGRRLLVAEVQQVVRMKAPDPVDRGLHTLEGAHMGHLGVVDDLDLGRGHHVVGHKSRHLQNTCLRHHLQRQRQHHTLVPGSRLEVPVHSCLVSHVGEDEEVLADMCSVVPADTHSEVLGSWRELDKCSEVPGMRWVDLADMNLVVGLDCTHSVHAGCTYLVAVVVDMEDQVPK